ncbi:LysM peptidoglycan-binding domain-containing protein [Alloalcanivorax mobilis]|uniref:LysM peptidoglycan-binding domain-containing protein n=1 Tax=Alloalcanivorax mobilis TaxID=2019569 RepID=UPI0018E40603|nr:LysM domain-containing protein [Alloalcanivorax mobilis]
MMKSLQRILVVGICLLVAGGALAAVDLRDNHPDVYYVKKGDTLWDISGRFLENPWQWPELWHDNPGIDNPHLIYPGDEIRLSWVNGQPRLTVNRGEAAKTRLADGTVKLTPRVRELDREDAIPAIPMSAIQSYLKEGLVVERDDIAQAPYVVGGQDGRVVYGMGDTIYARDPVTLWEQIERRYGLYRVGEEYVDPNTDEVLGYEARQVALASVQDHEEDMATLELVRSSEDVRVDDRLFSRPDGKVRAVLYPHAPNDKVTGRIIRFFDRINSVARNEVVVINRGEREGMEPGHVLEIYQEGELVRDRQRDEMVRLPRTKAGTLVLFKVFEKVSYALVMTSTRPVHMNDLVESPAGSY